MIALGTGLAILSMSLVQRDAPPQALSVMAAAGAFAAVSAIFGSPVIGAVLIIEATGIGGPTLALVLLPGLLAAGVGSLVFIGLGSWSGFSTAAWALSPFPLPDYGGPSWGDFGWSILLAVGAAIVVFVVMELARLVLRFVLLQTFVVTVVAGLVVGGLAIAFEQATGYSENAVLFSGEPAFGSLFASQATIALSTLALLLVFKGLAWSISLSSFRGGPTFPAIFLGVVAGMLAGHLPSYSETPAIAVLVAAGCVATLRLPLASVMIASLLCAKAGLTVTPLDRGRGRRRLPDQRGTDRLRRRTNRSRPWQPAAGRPAGRVLIGDLDLSPANAGTPNRCASRVPCPREQAWRLSSRGGARKCLAGQRRHLAGRSVEGLRAGERPPP